MSTRKSERLLNLVVMLMKAEHFVSRREIQRMIPDYAEAPSPDAFERMFERDKAELRELGLALRTGPEGASGDDAGYRIVADDITLPATVFTAGELTILTLAARAWEQATWGSAARAGRLKLSAYAEGSADPMSDLVLRVASPDDAYGPLLAAITRRVPVSFDYRPASAAVSSHRHLEPWVLTSHGGAWYALGHDLDRQAPRAFRLSRIRGPILIDAAVEPFPVVSREQIREALELLKAPETSAEASLHTTLSIATGKGQALRRTGRWLGPDPDRPGHELVEVSAPSERVLIQQLASVATDVIPLDPDVREQLRLHLAAVLADLTGKALP